MKKYSKGGIIALCSLVYFTSYFSRKSFAVVTAGMLEAAVMEKELAGLIGTVMFVMYGVGQIVSGFLGDRIPPKWLILIGLATTGVCNGLMSVIPAYLMIPVWAVNGLAQAMMWPPIVKILAESLDHETYVKANLLVTTAAHVATILLYVYVPVCLRYWEWSTVFISAGALALVMFAVFIIGISLIMLSQKAAEAAAPDGEKADNSAEKSAQSVQAEEAEQKRYTLPELIRASGLLPIFFAIIAIGFLRDGIESWLPTLYSEAFGRSAEEATLISMILPVFAIVCVAIITVLHKKVLKNEALGSAVMFALSIVLCIPLVFLIKNPSGVSGAVCLVLVSLICGIMHSCNFLLISCLPGRLAKFGRSSTTLAFT